MKRTRFIILLAWGIALGQMTIADAEDWPM